MRKFLLLLYTFFSFLIINAQVSDQDAAIATKLITKNSTLIGLSAEDLQNVMISSTYKTVDGLQMVYLQQSYLGIPVYNQMQVLAFQQEKLVSAAGGRIPTIQKLIKGYNGIPAVSVITALQTALFDAKATALVGRIKTAEAATTRNGKSQVCRITPKSGESRTPMM